ncbi:MAG TPA: site-specific integrase [Thermoanaerobaculia bacterium]|nr:site-specific integrase [Thermoanaerobaculia bacterium]
MDLPRVPLPDEDVAEMLAALTRRFDDFVARAAVRRSPHTIRWYRAAFARYRRYLAGAGATPATVRARLLDLDGWVDWNLTNGVSHIATNTYWRALRPFFNDWEATDGAPNPYRTHRAPRFNPAPPKALSREHCARILLTAANYPRWDTFQRARAAAVLGVMLYAGLRRGEALGLLNGDVNFEHGELRVARGKGAFGGKTRFVPMNADLLRLVRAYQRERERRGLDGAPEFFVSTRSRAGLSGSGLHLIVRAVVRGSGVAFSPHALRHSFVTHLLRAGVPLYMARDLAGHSHIETTLIYTKVFPKDRHDSVRKLSFE